MANIEDMGEPLLLRQATPGEHTAILELIDSVREWLRTIGTDQWEVPWPSENGRSKRTLAAIEAGRTWVVRDDVRLAATVTVSPNDHGIWPAENRQDPAAYVRQLVVNRDYAGQGLGAQLLDWAAIHALRVYGARWVRVDLWTTNTRLHAYYRRQGFKYCALSPVHGYPSAVLYQKPTGQILPPEAPLFSEDPESRELG
jgi:GNAT superfamily N-acetyltransferase